MLKHISVANMRMLASLSAGLCFMPALFGQGKVYPSRKSSPARIEGQIMLLNETVLTQQWMHTLDPVNAPKNSTLLNPGQCIRIGVIATGDDRDEYLKHTKLSFGVRLAGQTVSREYALMSFFKKMKPEGGDFVTSALAAGGVKAPDAIRSLASLGISESN